MKIGDLVVTSDKGNHTGVITDIEKLYPNHPESPIRGIRVHWCDTSPRWWRKGLMFSAWSVMKVG